MTKGMVKKLEFFSIRGGDVLKYIYNGLMHPEIYKKKIPFRGGGVGLGQISNFG